MRNSSVSIIKIVVIYMLFGLTWIVASDKILYALIRNNELLNYVSTFKGSLFVIITSLFIYFSLRYEFRKREDAERILVENKKELLQMLDNIPYGVVLLNKEYSNVFTNKEMEEITGYTGREWTKIEELFEKLVNDEKEAKLIISKLEMLIKENKNGLKIEIAINDKNKRQKAVTVANVLLNENDILLIFSDITLNKKYERELRDSEEKYRTILEVAEEGVWILDANHKSIFVNRKIEEILDYSKNEIVKKEFFDFITPENRDVAKNYLELCVYSSTWKNDTKLIRKDGSEIWVIISSTPISDSYGNFTGMLLMMTDITARKAAESEILKAKEMAEGANSAKSQFLANMSHEMRTPMNGIMGMQYLLSNTDLNPEQFEYLEMMKQSSETLLNIIDDVLDLSRIETGKIHIEEIEFSMNEIMNDTVKIIYHNVTKKGLTLKTNVAENINYLVLGDPKFLQQILLNVINNSIKFTKTGGIEFTIKELSKDENTARILFSIIDTGIGIEEDKIHRIFDIFYQVDAASSKKYGGTGLGLSIVKKLIEIMGGTLNVKSQIGKGTTFEFELPLKFINSAKAEEDTKEKVKIESSETILIVEDNDINQSLIKQLLNKKKFVSEVASNGLEAVKLVMQKDYSVILMDIQMPEMNGYEATEKIRELDKEKGIRTPIIALTAYAMEEDRERCFASDMDDFISKPFNPEELYEKIAKYKKK